jgi:hypothetical protein
MRAQIKVGAKPGIYVVKIHQFELVGASPAVDCKDTRKTCSEDWFVRPLYIMVRNSVMEMLRAFKTHPRVVP